MYDRDKLMADLRRHEGWATRPYTDIVGKVTIGMGRNLTDNGLRDDEIRLLAENDINGVEADLDRNIPWWRELPEAPARGLINMAYNLGWPRLSRFRKMLSALHFGDYEQAAVEAMDSRWAKQVGYRASEIALLFLRGTDG